MDKASRKRIAERFYAIGSTQKQISDVLDVSQATVSGDLGGFINIDKLKPAKTATNPKGAGPQFTKRRVVS